MSSFIFFHVSAPGYTLNNLSRQENTTLAPLTDYRFTQQKILTELFKSPVLLFLNSSYISSSYPLSKIILLIRA